MQRVVVRTQFRMRHALQLTCLMICLCVGLMPLHAYAQGCGVTPEHGIPVLSITIEGEGTESPEEAFALINSSIFHTEQRSGVMELVVPAGYRGDYSTQELEGVTARIEHLRGRGNSTWTASKKPYKLKLADNVDLLGMGASKHWVLLSNPIDTSLLRNRVASYIGNAFGLSYTPKMLPVDLVVNGEYRGNYYLGEQVRVGKTRVDIDKMSAKDNAAPNITGGYLIGMSPQESEPEENVIITNHEVRFCGEEPSFAPQEKGTSAQKAYLAGYLQQVEDAIYAQDGSNKSGTSWTEYMDMESTAQYWWIQEFFTNSPDAYWTPSTYLYKPRGDKLYWGPLWDFDQSMSSGITGFNISTPWLDYLRSFDTDYQASLLKLWPQLDACVDELVRAGGVLDQYADEMRDSWQADFNIWVAGTLREPFAKSFDKEVEELRSWLQTRRAWIGENIERVTDGPLCRVDFVVDGQSVGSRVIRKGSGLASAPSWTKKKGKVFCGWALPDGTLLDEYSTFDEDTKLVARYVDASAAQLGEGIYLGAYEVWMSLDEGCYETSFSIVPEHAQERYAAWTSSDEKIAEVDANGQVRAQGVGDVVIVGTLESGASGSYTLHVLDSMSDLSVEASSIELDTTSLELGVGEYGQIKARVLPQTNSLVQAYYESSDESIVTVDENGVLAAVAPGTANVRAYVPGMRGEVAVSCKVVVTKEGHA